MCAFLNGGLGLSLCETATARIWELYHILVVQMWDLKQLWTGTTFERIPSRLWRGLRRWAFGGEGLWFRVDCFGFRD